MLSVDELNLLLACIGLSEYLLSIGILILRLSGHVPFHDDNPNALENLICQGDLKFSNPLWLDVHEAGTLVGGMM